MPKKKKDRTSVSDEVQEIYRSFLEQTDGTVYVGKKQAAKLIGSSIQTIDRAIMAEQLKVCQPRKEVKIHLMELAKYMARN